MEKKYLEEISKELGFKKTETRVNFILQVVKGRKVESVINDNFEQAANYRMMERELLELEDIDPLERMQEDDSIE